jgi:hypothetical protein
MPGRRTGDDHQTYLAWPQKYGRPYFWVAFELARISAMNWSALPQPVAARILELDGRVSALLHDAATAEAKVAYARNVIGGKIEAPKDVFKSQQSGFDAIYADARQARERAETQRKLFASAKAWIAGLPANSQLLLVQPVAQDLDLSALRDELTRMRTELKQLQSVTVPADDIETRVHAYVTWLARQATPMVRGYGPGENLDVRWPGGIDANRRNGNGFSTIDGNALLFTAMLDPDGLKDQILKAIQATQPMGKLELEARRDTLTREIDELSYVVAELLDRAGEAPDPLMAPHHILGVRTKEDYENGPAEGDRVDSDAR